MQLQSTRFQNIFGKAGIVALVAIGLLAASDINDSKKVEVAYDAYKQTTTTAADNKQNMQTKAEFTATVSLLRGIKGLADNVYQVDVQKVANAIACAKANELIDFSSVDTGFNPAFIELLKRDGVQVEATSKPSEIKVDAEDMLQALAHVDTAYTTLQIAGIPQDILDIAFEKALLNQRLQVATAVYGAWASQETAEG